MKLTEKNLKDYLKTKEEMDYLIHERITEITKKLIEYGAYSFMKNWSVDNIEYDEDNVLVTIYESWAYGGYDSSNISLPQSYLYDDNYEEKIKLDCENRKKLKEENDILNKAKKEKEKEEKEKAEFIRLNQKFGKK